MGDILATVTVRPKTDKANFSSFLSACHVAVVAMPITGVFAMPVDTLLAVISADRVGYC